MSWWDRPSRYGHPPPRPPHPPKELPFHDSDAIDELEWEADRLLGFAEYQAGAMPWVIEQLEAKYIGVLDRFRVELHPELSRVVVRPKGVIDRLGDLA